MDLLVYKVKVVMETFIIQMIMGQTGHYWKLLYQTFHGQVCRYRVQVNMDLLVYMAETFIIYLINPLLVNIVLLQSEESIYDLFPI
jgi:hypothetical protein